MWMARHSRDEIAKNVYLLSGTKMPVNNLFLGLIRRCFRKARSVRNLDYSVISLNYFLNNKFFMGHKCCIQK